jgi:hypothetical protein
VGGNLPVKTDTCSTLVSLSKMAEKRFEKVYSQGALEGTEIWVDTETGVNYLYHFSGYTGGLTPLLDRDGKPVITTVIK